MSHLPTETVSADEWLAIERAMSMAETPAKKARSVAPTPQTPTPTRPAVSLQFTPSRSPSAPAVSRPVVHQTPVLLSMYDKHRFLITRYPAALTDWLRQFPGSVHGEVMGQPVFHFPFKHYADFLVQVRQLRYANVQEVPPRIVAALCNAQPPEAAFDVRRVPAGLWEQLFPFQRQGVEFIVSRNGRALVGDEMGLGKTVQGLATAAYYRDEWPLLIVCPSSLRVAWSQAIERFLPG